jgi:hypothetical protein
MPDSGTARERHVLRIPTHFERPCRCCFELGSRTGLVFVSSVVDVDSDFRCNSNSNSNSNGNAIVNPLEDDPGDDALFANPHGTAPPIEPVADERPAHSNAVPLLIKSENQDVLSTSIYLFVRDRAFYSWPMSSLLSYSKFIPFPPLCSS